MRISHGRETAKVRFNSITMSMNSPGSLSEKYVHTVGVLDVKMVRESEPSHRTGMNKICDGVSENGPYLMPARLIFRYRPLPALY